MTDPPAPSLAHYRVTLFFGPDQVGDQVADYCVFNVKKRSWKGGVQLAVEIGRAQLAELRMALNFDGWMHSLLAPLPSDEQPAYRTRADEVLLQELCRAKLQCALATDIPQENARVAAQALTDELARAVRAGADEIKHAILAELDLSAR